MITKADTFASAVDKIVLFADKTIVPLMFALAFLFFLIGMVRFFFSQNQENREKGRQFVIWGIIGLVVIVALWGIVNLFVGLLVP